MDLKEQMMEMEFNRFIDHWVESHPKEVKKILKNHFKEMAKNKLFVLEIVGEHLDERINANDPELVEDYEHFLVESRMK